MKKLATGFMSVIGLFSGPALFADQKAIVKATIASIWTHVPDKDEGESSGKYPLLSKHVPHHDTQVLLGDPLYILDDKDNSDDWLKVSTPEQFVWDKNEKRLRACRGWIKRSDIIETDDFLKHTAVVSCQVLGCYEKSALDAFRLKESLSIGTKVYAEKLDESWSRLTLYDGTLVYAQSNDLVYYSDLTSLNAGAVRQKMVDLALSFVGSPYCWGGTSAYQKDRDDIITSVDCSGLMYLIGQVYRFWLEEGLIVPRNARDQFSSCKPIALKDLQPADIICFERNGSIPHVVMYSGKDSFVEANGGDLAAVYATRVVSTEKLFGKSLSELADDNTCMIGEQAITMHARSFFK